MDEILRFASVNQRMDQPVHDRALALERHGVKPLDALHLATAEVAGATHFLTCDDRLLRRYTGPVAAMTPTRFAEAFDRGARDGG